MQKNFSKLQNEDAKKAHWAQNGSGSKIIIAKHVEVRDTPTQLHAKANQTQRIASS